MTATATSPGPARVQQFVDLGDALLAYDEAGEGPPVVYAHGLNGSRANDDAWRLIDWSPVAAAGRCLVRYDALGHGQSTGRPVHTDYTWERRSRELLAVLDRVAGPEPADAIGASMGCGALLHAAVKRPERLRRLVLVTPSTAWETRPKAADGLNAAADFVEHAGLTEFFAALPDLPLPSIMEQAPTRPPLPDIPEELYTHVLRGDAASDLPDPEALRGLGHPALILAWADDPGHPVSTAEKLRGLLPGARLHVSPDYADVRSWGDRAAAFLTAD
jgi:pimeloyl-ACP methyl ester carboxylesterase